MRVGFRPHLRVSRNYGVSLDWTKESMSSMLATETKLRQQASPNNLALADSSQSRGLTVPQNKPTSRPSPYGHERVPAIPLSPPLTQPTALARRIDPVIPPTYAPIPVIPKRPSASGFSGSRYDPDSLSNPYGAGSPYKADGLMNPYSQYGSPYSNKSWTNQYATDAPKLYDSQGNYRGRLSANRYDPDSTSNPYGRYGSKYSSESINNPYGAGNPYSSDPIYVVPSED